MSQILKSLQLPITGSSPSSSLSGFGVVYASGSNKFYYKNPSGTEFDLVTSNGYINVLYYTGSAIGDGTTQTYTWSKPLTGLKYIEVCCVGAGGGGGSGRKGLALNSGWAGVGGAGGAIVWTTFDSSILSSSYTITVGAGGAGGLRQTTNATNGNPGLKGGNTSFGSLVVAEGGGGGPGGAQFTVSTQASGGNSANCTPSGFPYSLNGCSSQIATTQPGNEATAPIIFNAQGFVDVNAGVGATERWFGAGGGGGGLGGGRSPSFTNGSPAGAGSSGYQFTTLITNGGTPGNSGSSGTDATAPTDNMITTLLQFTGSTTLYGLGGGGHGGGYGTTGNGGNGSNGGLYGAGGGGGGATGSTTALSGSGIGGSGSAGLCIVVEFY